MGAGFGNAVANTGRRETRWLTPERFVRCLGEFDLDPCGAPGHELAKKTYLLERNENGLELGWFGRVWLNPPYGKEAVPFIEKMIEHQARGFGGTALIFARTETKMFQDLIWPNATAMLFVRSRIKFIRDDLTEGDAANAPSVFIAFGSQDADALRMSGIPGAYVPLKDVTIN